MSVSHSVCRLCFVCGIFSYPFSIFCAVLGRFSPLLQEESNSCFDGLDLCASSAECLAGGLLGPYVFGTGVGNRGLWALGANNSSRQSVVGCSLGMR